MLLLRFSAAYSLMLFPALSCIAVGGILLLMTNMQVIIVSKGCLSILIQIQEVVLLKLRIFFGNCMSVCFDKVGNLFAAHRSTIITLYNGAFDSSSAVFLIIKVYYSPIFYCMFDFVEMKHDLYMNPPKIWKTNLTQI